MIPCKCRNSGSTRAYAHGETDIRTGFCPVHDIHFTKCGMIYIIGYVRNSEPKENGKEEFY